ncbi:MAG: hypothetical protein UR39_C0003G0118 [Candidatus Woesebacteria bacterium GW2011_GWA1_33_30]|uniref:Uncharacterized protein n=1 Tax=Candidatus Woesebacteria bacterium GW2011_GWA2_33_28 TaxID=1618561 RepID=A0A0G0A8W8_9BACT|nr:MAG: hypothetical protein UR38_C0003G0121 [Candidatus Woesebacteria bacterium GW2011_GWA2_33_28]KKP48583.1 MAG: hypothetical protein UR39_C0003G0118 [Candidatus Woesebacteria bacterium GW2011_GWA1_33_30]KKP49722.1 MAG: hypothetical protein UR40_C0004G0121 [Microgenomates group bacterium GW2011_GWC1_33_32]KKP52339.1 MAG: hypothetical protein UR44_C0003G0121 [Candidatus Woesebacteria bacterium GW2011_GWB1_33_38]
MGIILDKMKNNPKQNNSLIILLSVLLLISCIIAGIFAYQVQNLTKEIKKLKTEQLLTQTPAPTLDLTANWKTYTNEDLSFKYPSDWLRSGDVISPDMPGSPHNNLYPYGLFLNVFDKNATLKTNAYTYSGCMKETSTQTVNGVFIKRFIEINTGQCKDRDQKQRIIWIVPSASSYGPSVAVFYQVDDSEQVEQIVTQILSTFKFLDNEITSIITSDELNNGWYWGFKDQKKLNTPSDWVYQEVGRSSCWHKVGVLCQ